MDAILILLMPYNDRFQSDRVVQPFLVNDVRHLVFLTSLHRGVQSFSRIHGNDFHGIPSAVDSCLPAGKRFRLCIIVRRQNMKVFRQLVVKSVIVVIQLSFHREAGSYLRNRVLDVLDPGFRIVFFFPFII